MTPACRPCPAAEPNDNLVRRSSATSKQPVPSRSTERELAQNTQALPPLVATFGTLEPPAPNNGGTATPKRALTALGVFGVVVGIGGIAATDLVQLSAPGRAHVVILTMSTLQSIVLALLGAALLRPSRRSPRRSSRRSTPTH